MLVERPKLTLLERLYVPAILHGLQVTWGHFWQTLTIFFFRKKKHTPSLMDMSPSGNVTLQYPEEKWPMPDGYRGAPTLVKDEYGREKCVSCQMCEFICPPRAIHIQPGEISPRAPNAHVERAPKEFDIDMLRCIYCGLCEEVCPEEAIFLKKEFPILVGYDRKSMIHNKEKLYQMGGVFYRPIHKWNPEQNQLPNEAPPSSPTSVNKPLTSSASLPA